MKTCSYCGNVNSDLAVQCTECGRALPLAEPSDPELLDPNLSLEIVGSFGDVAEASLTKALLEQAGIEACIPEELNPSPFGNFPPLAHVTVRVAKKDYAAAKELLSKPQPPASDQTAA